MTNAQKRNQQQAIEDRRSELKKLHLKLKTFVTDLHLKLSSVLVKYYQYVALGKINVSSIVKKATGLNKNTIGKRAKRDLLCWQHFKFRMRIMHRSRDTNCFVHIQDESYTSKTCGMCGILNNKLGSSETFICSKCGYETHRDVNGARNILLKSFGLFPFGSAS